MSPVSRRKQQLQLTCGQDLTEFLRILHLHGQALLTGSQPVQHSLPALFIGHPAHRFLRMLCGSRLFHCTGFRTSRTFPAGPFFPTGPVCGSRFPVRCCTPMHAGLVLPFTDIVFPFTDIVLPFTGFHSRMLAVMRLPVTFCGSRPAFGQFFLIFPVEGTELFRRCVVEQKYLLQMLDPAIQMCSGFRIGCGYGMLNSLCGLRSLRGLRIHSDAARHNGSPYQQSTEFCVHLTKSFKSSTSPLPQNP